MKTNFHIIKKNKVNATKEVQGLYNKKYKIFLQVPKYLNEWEDISC